MLSKHILLLILISLIPACTTEKTNQISKDSLSSVQIYQNQILDLISKAIQIEDTDQKGSSFICEQMKSAIIGYLKAQNNLLNEKIIKEAYKKFIEQPNEINFNIFESQINLIKPILYKLQTDVVFDARDILSTSNPQYKAGKLGQVCSFMDLFLRLSFEETSQYMQFIINLLNLNVAPTSI